MRFSEFLGNEEVVSKLQERAVSGRPFHAYIFEGAEGIGKKTLAYTFAQTLICENPDPDGEPCQECSACRKLLSGNHSDIHYIAPDGRSIKDDQITALQEVLLSKPYDGNRTVVIIDKADTITERAQNRLLKTLEEPEPTVIIILLTEKISDLLPTIVSRSAVIRLKPVDSRDIAEFMIDHYGFDSDSASVAATYSYGSPGKAIRLLREEDLTVQRRRSMDCACGLLEKRTPAEFIKLFEEGEQTQERMLETLDMMIFWYRDLLLLSQNAEMGLIMNIDHIDRLRTFGRKVSVEKICRAIEKLEDAKYDILMNMNTDYVLKNLYFEIN